MAKNDALTKTGTTALARPAFIDGNDRRGADTIERGDLQMPRLALAQALSPELDSSSPKYIDGLRNGDAFNNLTGEVYGKEPIEVVIVRVDRPRFVEFNPRDAGGGIKDFNIAPDDPRTQFGPNGEKPVATKFMEYVALLLPSREPIAISFKGSGLKVARKLNALIKFANAPSFAMKYVLTPTIEKNPKGSYAVFNVKPAGFVDEETYRYAEAVYESIKDRALSVDREDDAHEGSDNNTPF